MSVPGGERGEWEKIACPICDNTQFAPLFVKDGEPFVRCRECNFALINPRRSSAEIRAGYDADYSAGYTRKADKKLRRSRRRVQRLTREYGLHGRWLDVGCSAGFVVKAAIEAGFDAYGVDIETGGIAFGRAQLGLTGLRCGVLEEQGYPSAHFAAITAYDVIEHVPDLNGFVAELKRLLAPRGVLDLGTPDIGHWRVPRKLETWGEFKPSEHLYYFDSKTLARLLARHQLRIDRQRLALKPGLKVCVVHA